MVVQKLNCYCETSDCNILNKGTRTAYKTSTADNWHSKKKHHSTKKSKIT